jgi:hypothetical protein
MAKKAAKSEVNKSQAIRDYVKKHSDAGPTAVAAALNKREGWNISPAYVSTIKNKTKKPASSAPRAARAGGKLSGFEESLLQAKDFAKQAGGINRAKAALDLLARITD